MERERERERYERISPRVLEGNERTHLDPLDKHLQLVPQLHILLTLPASHTSAWESPGYLARSAWDTYHLVRGGILVISDFCRGCMNRLIGVLLDGVLRRYRDGLCRDVLLV